MITEPQYLDALKTVRDYLRQIKAEIDGQKVVTIDRIRDQDLSIRLSERLILNGIGTVEDLAKHTKKDLLKIRGLGKKSIIEVEDLLEKFGYKMRYW